MIIRLLIAAAVLYGLFRFVKYVQNKPQHERRSYYLTLLLSIAAAGLVLLSITGRVHWLAGIIGAVMPFLRQFALNHLYKKLNGTSTNTDDQPQQPPTAEMNIAQALSILGLEPGATEQEIIRAHRSLMQKLHPDRGGNDYLASQLNTAKALLLKNLG